MLIALHFNVMPLQQEQCLLIHRRELQLYTRFITIVKTFLITCERISIRIEPIIIPMYLQNATCLFFGNYI